MTGGIAGFWRDGFLGPVPLLTPDECRAVLAQLQRDEARPEVSWSKGHFPDWLLQLLQAKRSLIDLLRAILGEDIILWGVSLARRAPEMLHPWHVDIESSAPDGRFVTAWIGLENVTGESGLRLIAGSHRGKTIQQVRAEKGRSRSEHSNQWVLSAALEEDQDNRLVQPEVGDGDAILFDGRIWHGSFNASHEMRTALLLQFAAAECPVRIPDGLDWPFRFLDAPLPPVVRVHGKADDRVNRVVAPAATVPVLPSSIRRLPLPLAEDPEVGWKRYPLFRGSTAALDSMSCHAAVLSPGYAPHPPHTHADEELLIILHGQADLLAADGPSFDGAHPIRVKAGDFAYYPPGHHHTIRNAGTSPVTYMMFRWRTGGAFSDAKRLGPTLFPAPAQADPVPGRSFVTSPVFSAPTRWLRRLTCHMSRLERGTGYPPHADAYDVAIIVQSGRVRTLRQEVGPGAVVYCSAGELHGMRNVGDEPAHYIVFEFHGRPLPHLAEPANAELRAGPVAARIDVSPAE